MNQIDPIEQVFMDFHAYLHKENPEGKTELIKYGEWADKVREVIDRTTPKDIDEIRKEVEEEYGAPNGKHNPLFCDKTDCDCDEVHENVGGRDDCDCHNIGEGEMGYRRADHCGMCMPDPKLRVTCTSLDCPERKGGVCKHESRGKSITSSCCKFPVNSKIGADGSGFLTCSNCGMGCSPDYEDIPLPKPRIEPLEEIINILGEMVIGNNEGRWVDRIWSQEMCERLLKVKELINHD